jgi:hypothetical protein
MYIATPNCRDSLLIRKQDTWKQINFINFYYLRSVCVIHDCSLHTKILQFKKLMFVPCIIRRRRNDQQYAQICTTALFYIPAPICFGSSLPSSGSFLEPSELLENTQ